MESRFPLQARRLEGRAEQRGNSEVAKRILLALFSLTTQACDPFGGNEDRGYSSGHQEANVELAKGIEAKSPETLESKAKTDFKAKLIELEQAGYSVEISGLNLVVDTDKPLDVDQVRDLAGLEMNWTGVKLTSGTDPWTTLQAQLKESDKTVQVPIHQLRVSPDQRNLKLQLENWLTDQTMIEVTLKDWDSNKQTFDEWQAEQDAEIKKIQTAIRQDKTKLAETYGKLLLDHGVSLNAMDIMRTRPGNGLEQIQSLFNDPTYDIHSVTLNGFKADTSAGSSPYIAWVLDTDRQNELPETGTMELAGTLTNVELRRYTSSMDQAPPPDWWTPRTPASQIFKDAYGNIIIVDTTRTLQAATEYSGEYYYYSQSISINVPTEFLTEVGSENDWHSWNADLSKLGLPELKDIVYTHVERPVVMKKDSIGFEYNFYYQGNDALTKNIYDGYYDAAQRGIQQMQIAFYGYELEQQLTKNILIVPQDEKNGFFAPRNSTTIALTDVHMRLGDSNYGEVISTSRHETAHALFNHLRLNESKELSELHKRLTPAFFQAINESKWETNGFGGHSQDNLTEFFASFTNGLLLEYDTESMLRKKLTPALAAEYADAAKTLREILAPMLKKQNSSYENIEIVEKLQTAEKIARDIVAGN